MERQEELLLNKQLYEEAINDKVDFHRIEELLKMGANPVDYYNDDEETSVFYDIVNDRTSGEELCELTKLFLKYGMDVFSTEMDNLHSLTWIRDIYGFETLKLIFDERTDWMMVESYVGDMIGDMWQFETFDINDQDDLDSLFWAIRETMYLAGLVEHDIEKCEWTYKLLRPDLNKGTALKEFMEWNDFEYEYIVNEQENDSINGSLDGNTIIIKRKATKEVAWRFTFD